MRTLAQAADEEWEISHSPPAARTRTRTSERYKGGTPYLRPNKGSQHREGRPWRIVRRTCSPATAG